MRNSDGSLAEHAKLAMEKGSKSFSLAALLFDSDRRVAARYLYSWCRHCDDAVDSAPDRATAIARLGELRRLTNAALNGEWTGVPAFDALRNIAQTHSIPKLYPLELLEGMRMDVEGHRFRTLADLELYCYRVASVVGLMMVHVMGISSPKALRHAVDTGLAMQMTNIARDVREDFELGRVYLPEAWFIETGLRYPRFGERLSENDCSRIVKRLLERADAYYESGRKGLRYLPLRAALAVGSAQYIYREIGVLVRKRGPEAWQTRAVVPFVRKLVLLAKAAAFVLVDRLRKSERWEPCEFNDIFGPENLTATEDLSRLSSAESPN